MFVIGTAGHIDHGKSLLVEALTGIDPDRLGEEKARGMTIDLGFAWLTLPSGRTVSIVDVPGHERFIKNMLAGAGGIDLALLVVAADDGVMPQTREHFAILDLLGVGRGVVALTKCDLADEDWLDIVAADIDETLSSTTLSGAPIIRCSATSRDGLAELLAALDGAISGIPPKRDLDRPRLPIDRMFTIGGFGTVVTGTLIDGALNVGDDIEVMPAGLRGRIRGLQNHGEPVERTLPGTRTAVNISGIAKAQLRRGDVLARPGTLSATSAFDAHIRTVAGAARPLRHNTRLTLHAFADEAGATMRLLDRTELGAGDAAFAQLKLDGPVAIVRGDRFVLRTPDDTVAGGIVLDTAPRRHRRNHQPTLDALAARISGRPRDAIMDALAAHVLAEPASLRASTQLDHDEFDAALSELQAEGSVTQIGDSIAATLTITRLTNDATSALRELLAANPLRPGMNQEELRGRLGLDAKTFTALLPHHDGVVLRGAVAALEGFSAALTTEQQQNCAAYLTALRDSPYSPPIGLRLDPALFARLTETGAIVDAGRGIVFDAEVFGEMTNRVRAHLATEETITLAQVRDMFGTSRKYAQAFLEELDRRKITRRLGDERVLR
jgi:selenocysteine-specific elongation factor